MDRRSFLKNTALGGSAAAATTLAAPAYAQGNRTLTMVTTWGRGLAGVFDAAQRAADNINGMADGALTIEVKGAGELVGAFEVFDAVTAGQADLYHGADYYFVGQHPAYAFFTSVPFGMTAQELVNWYYHDGGAAFHDELGEIFGLKSFLAGNTGAQAGGWFSKEINGPEDFNGLKFRMPGLGGLALGKLGASVQNLPGSEVYQALASGAIDGTEWIGPWADEKAGFQEIRCTDNNGRRPGNDIHEMGGVRMGRDPRTSLLDKWNRLHLCKNVFVTDGACMPSTSTQNPSLTYMALAARAANFAFEELKRGAI